MIGSTLFLIGIHDGVEVRKITVKVDSIDIVSPNDII